MWNTITEDADVELAERSADLPVLDGLREAFRAQGYEQGYTRATRDAAALLVLAVEEFARARSLGGVDRAMLRDFQRYAERHVDGLTPAFTYVEAGLGI